MNDNFPPARGIPMHLLTERGLNEAFLDVVEQHRREGLPVVICRDEKLTRLPVEELLPEVARARHRIEQLSIEIAKFEQPSPFRLNETPPQ